MKTKGRGERSHVGIRARSQNSHQGKEEGDQWNGMFDIVDTPLCDTAVPNRSEANDKSSFIKTFWLSQQKVLPYHPISEPGESSWKIPLHKHIARGSWKPVFPTSSWQPGLGMRCLQDLNQCVFVTHYPLCSLLPGATTRILKAKGCIKI